MAAASVHRTSRRASRWYVRLRRRRAAAASARATAGAGAAVGVLTLSPRASMQSRLGPPDVVVHGEGLLGHSLPGELPRAGEAGGAQALPQGRVGQGAGERVGQRGGVVRVD